MPVIADVPAVADVFPLVADDPAVNDVVPAVANMLFRVLLLLVMFMLVMLLLLLLQDHSPATLVLDWATFSILLNC